MRPERAGRHAIAGLAIILSACGSEADPRSHTVVEGSPEALAMQQAEECATGKAGPLACLVTTFGAGPCSDAEVLAATIVKDAPDARLRITTAFWAGGKCHAALRAAARERGFDGDPFMTFAPFGENGYREMLDFTTGPGWSGQGENGSGIVWERIKP